MSLCFGDGHYLSDSSTVFRIDTFAFIITAHLFIHLKYTVDSGSTYTEYQAYAHLASGLSVGLSALGAGMAIGIVGDAGVRANGQQPKLFVGMILILIFAEALGLYGLIVAIVLSQK